MLQVFSTRLAGGCRGPQLQPSRISYSPTHRLLLQMVVVMVFELFDKLELADIGHQNRVFFGLIMERLIINWHLFQFQLLGSQQPGMARNYKSAASGYRYRMTPAMDRYYLGQFI